MPTGFDFPAAREYIYPAEAAAMDNPEFDYDIIVRPIEGRMMRTIWRIVREREAAEDALQEALTVVWKKRGTVVRHPNPEALILRIAITEAWDALRKSRRRIRREIPGLPERPAPDEAAPVEKTAEGRELHDAVLEAIGRLPRRQATAILLRLIEEQPFEAIAQAMGCSPSTARVHVMRGKAALARQLADFRLPAGSEAAGKENGT